MIQVQRRGIRDLAHDGFSFMELVVAILILGILMGIGIPAYMSWVEKARINTTQTNLKVLKSAIDLYHMDSSSYPQKLESLVIRPKNAPKAFRPYMQKLPQDGWKHDFYYRVTPSGKHAYELYSYGPDGPDGGAPEDRISVWD